MWLCLLLLRTDINRSADKGDIQIASSDRYITDEMRAEHESRISKFVSQKSLSGASLAASYTGKTYSGSRPFKDVSDLTLTKCTFNKCYSSDYGGCVYQTGSSSVTAIECKFNQCYNTANNYGGGCIRIQDGTATMRFCTATGCYSYWLGGVLHITSGKGVLENCYSSACYAKGFGGSIWQSVGSSNVIASDCTFHACRSDYTSDNSYAGGAVANQWGSCTYERCLFEYCTSKTFDGAIGLRNPTQVMITNCTFTHCRADIDGAAIGVGTEGKSASITLSMILCVNCTSTDGHAIRIAAAKMFSWSDLCIEDCGSVPVYSVLNEPSSSSLNACSWLLPATPTAVFTDYCLRKRMFISRGGIYLIYRIIG